MLERLQEQVTERMGSYLRLQFVALVIGGAFLLVYATLGASWFLAESSQPDLRNDIDRASATVSRAQARGEQTDEAYERVQEAIPPADLQETDVFQDILAIADRNG